MDGLEAGVMDTPDIEAPELEQPDDAELGNAEGGLEAEPGTETTDSDGKDDPYTTRFGREYRTWRNTLKQTDPAAAKFIQRAGDDYGRLFALNQIAPRGVDEVREKFALLNTLTHGEAKGSEAITAMQQSLQEWDDFDQAVLSGDPKVFEGITPEFDAGLAKLAPAYLDRVAQSDPEAYQAAILPHLVGTLAKSPVIGSFNTAVDVLNEKPPEWLTPDQKTQWAADRMQRVRALVGQMSDAFNQMGQKAGEVRTAPVDKNRTEFEQQRTAFEQEKQKMHWDTKIEPKVQAHEKTTFDKLFDPYQKRLKLGDAQKAGAFKAFHTSIIDAAKGDKDFQRQYALYKSQKNPDAAAVSNFINVALSKYAKTAMDELVKDRYEPFLAGPRKTQQAGKPGTKPTGPVEPNVEIRSIKPPMHEIDHQRTPIPWLAQKKYYLTNGKIIQVRSA